MFLLAAVCVPWQWHVLASSTQTHSIAIAFVVTGVLILVGLGVFFIAGHPTHRWFEHRLRARQAKTARDEAARIWGLLCGSKKVVGTVITAAIVTQAINCLLFYMAGRAVGIANPFWLWVSFVPIVLAASALPLSIAGLGVRDYLLVLFLGILARVDAADALAASVIVFSVLIIISLFGGLLYIIYRPKSALGVTAS